MCYQTTLSVDPKYDILVDTTFLGVAQPSVIRSALELSQTSE